MHFYYNKRELNVETTKIKGDYKMQETVIHLSNFNPKGDGKSNDFESFFKCFQSAKAGDTIVIEPGKYLIDDSRPIPLTGKTVVYAVGAEFYFPQNLGAYPHRSMFQGKNISDFSWLGGKFYGYVYNPLRAINPWEPSACTKCIDVIRTKEGESKNIRIENVNSLDVAGGVVNVIGSFNELTGERYPIENVDVKGCCLENSGKFMWDYGYLWQRIVFPEFHEPQEIENAYRYMPEFLMSGEVRFEKERIYVEKMPQPIEKEGDTVCFFGNIPTPFKKGFCYYIVKEELEGENAVISVSETPNGEPITALETTTSCRLFRNLFTVHHGLYWPHGGGSGKGPIDLSSCDFAKLTDCRMNASGDSMHVYNCYNAIVANNHIAGSRMGAFFIAQFCKNVTVTGNVVLGGNGSRVLSVEKSTENITIVGNTFTGGGRGVWINQPYNFIMSENVFINNTQKCTPDPKIGRLTPNSGSYEYYPEIYFTTWQNGASYGPVIMRSNIIQTSEHCSAALAFNDGGKDIVFEGNVIKGGSCDIYVGKNCEQPHISNNIGVGNILDELPSERFDQKV